MAESSKNVSSGGRSGREDPPWCCQHQDVGRPYSATYSRLLRKLLHGTPQSQCNRLDVSSGNSRHTECLVDEARQVPCKQYS